MKASVQIITTRIGEQSRPSISVDFDSGKYIFNVPEGTQRFCYSQAFRLSKLRGVFLTRMHSDSIGGLPGLILTLSDGGTSNLSITASTGLTHYIAANHTFVVRKNIQIILNEVQSVEKLEQVYQDETVSISAFKLWPEGVAETVYRKRIHSFKKDLARKKRVVNTMFERRDLSEEDEGHDDQDTDSTSTELKGTNSSLCYILRGPTVPGKFNAKKAESLKVFGKDRGLLAKGESITLESGQVIYAHQVMAPSKPGSIVVLLDIPGKEHISSLVNNETLRSTLSNLENRPKVVIHMLGPGVLEEDLYSRWTNEICNGLHNILIAPGLHNDEQSHQSSSEHLDLLSKLDSSIFPSLPRAEKAILLPESLLKMNPPCIVASQLMEFRIEPNAMLLPVPPTKGASLPSPADMQTISTIIDNLEAVPQDARYSEEFVVPLGTGSAIPARYRNVSGTWFHHPDGSILFDAGEGTLCQMERRFGTELKMRLNQLKIIFVSHLHGDHQLGVISVVRAWIKANEDPPHKLFFIAPLPCIQWLKDVAILEGLPVLERVQFIPSDALIVSSFKKAPNSTTESLYLHAQLKSFILVPVIHCRLSFAATVEYKSGFKVSFSGDCRPSRDFAAAGKDSDLLIHEATFPNDMQENAALKRHCTFAEAIRVGERMNAKNVLLTHFSQRLPKYVSIPISPKPTFPSVIGVASDLMLIHMKDFPRMPILNDGSLSKFYGLDIEELNEERTEIDIDPDIDPIS